ncbi:MAG: hypothetical protein J5808_02895 [Paludibacteraceae bacterium]|nr:hypothetical protein [Paludibacteraceae bacterium]
MKRVLVAPLEWGLGHASRCIPLIYTLLQRGDEVLLAATGNARSLLAQEFPQCRLVDLAPSFSMRYSQGRSQVWAVIRSLPRLVFCSIREHRDIRRIVRQYQIDEVISDNRFGLWCKDCRSIYITHQLQIPLPRRFEWLEPLAAFLHRKVVAQYDVCWVPDYADVCKSLAGRLSHPRQTPANVTYIGPLSRFEKIEGRQGGGVLLLLSGPEPQRSLFERDLIEKYGHSNQTVRLVRGTKSAPALDKSATGVIEVVDMPATAELSEWIAAADCIEARSGYSTAMDLHVAGKLPVAHLTPTPGQPEQVYLSQYLKQKFHTL